jgi:hypothetical protein
MSHKLINEPQCYICSLANKKLKWFISYKLDTYKPKKKKKKSEYFSEMSAVEMSAAAPEKDLSKDDDDAKIKVSIYTMLVSLIYTISSPISSLYTEHRPKIVGLVSFVFTYFLYCSLSYFSAHLYAHFCADWSISGFFLHPFMVDTPHCSALRWFIVQGSTSISQAFVLISTFVIASLAHKK